VLAGLGLPNGHRVAVLLPNGHPFVKTFYGGGQSPAHVGSFADTRDHLFR
jgi:hypothetical protein